MENKEKRYPGNVTKSATSAALLIGAVMTVLTFALSQAGITLPNDVQSAIATIITGAAVFFAGFYTRGEKPRVEGAVQNSVADALAGLDFYEVMEAIAEGAAKDAQKTVTESERPAMEEMARYAQPVTSEATAPPNPGLNGGDFTPHDTTPEEM
jgi:hypothetical protein|nr:MAG TPA: hypothetical protein [Caudoviricetes sp.]